ncbi:MAG: hypothetical protein RR294_03385 [Bacilli bacterium]
MKKLTIFKSCIEKLKNYNINKNNKIKKVIVDTIKRDWDEEEYLEKFYMHYYLEHKGEFYYLNSFSNIPYFKEPLESIISQEDLKEIILEKNKQYFGEEEYKNIEKEIKKQL